MRVFFGTMLACFLAISETVFAAPKPQDIDAYRALVVQDARLATVGYRLAKANAPFCPHKERNPGWVLHSYRQYPDRETAQAAFAFPMPVAIAALVEGGPAQAAGLQVGESFTDLPGGVWWGGERVEHKPDSLLVETINARIWALFRTSEVIRLPIGSKSGEADRWVDLAPPLVCESSFSISTDGTADAGADGEHVRVSAKLAEFTPDDDEFATIVAHEMAHNLLNHQARLYAATTERDSGRRVGKSRELIRQTEVEADQLAIWLMANAGYDPNAALRFIERYGRKYGHGIFSDGTHYRWKKRREFMQAELDKMAQTERGPDGYFPPLLMTAQNAQSEVTK